MPKPLLKAPEMPSDPPNINADMNALKVYQPSRPLNRNLSKPGSTSDLANKLAQLENQGNGSTGSSRAVVVSGSGGTDVDLLAADGDVSISAPQAGQELVYDGSIKRWVNLFTAYSATIGDGVSTVYDLEHNLSTSDVTVTVRNVATGEVEMVDVEITSSDSIRLTFAVAPTASSERVVVLANGGSGAVGGGGSTGNANGNFTVNNQSTDYTAALGDANNLITITNASAKTLTIPPNASVAFPIGVTITVMQLGAGVITISPGAGVTIQTPYTVATVHQYSTAAIMQIAANVWVIAGDVGTSVNVYEQRVGFASYSSGGTITVTFSTPFATSCVAVVACGIGGSVNVDNGSLTTSGCILNTSGVSAYYVAFGT